jgi:hypothetical protein
MVVAGDGDKLAPGAIGSKQTAGLVMKFGSTAPKIPADSEA